MPCTRQTRVSSTRASFHALVLYSLPLKTRPDRPHYYQCVAAPRMEVTHRKLLQEPKPKPDQQTPKGCQKEPSKPTIIGPDHVDPIPQVPQCQQHKHQLHIVFSPLVVFAFILLFLLLGFLCFFVVRKVFRRLGDSGETASASPIILDNDDGENDGVDSVNDNNHREDDSYNPVWLINTMGLQQSTIDSIAACVYRHDLMDDGITDCAVCLAEFEDGVRIRVLPKCNHAFHLPCIDAWLRSHQNCPLCRAVIVSVPADDDKPCSNNNSDNVAGEEEMNNIQVGIFENGNGVAEIYNPIRTPSDVDCVESPIVVVVEEDVAMPLTRSVSMDLGSSLGNEEKERNGCTY